MKLKEQAKWILSFHFYHLQIKLNSEKHKTFYMATFVTSSQENKFILKIPGQNFRPAEQRDAAQMS